MIVPKVETAQIEPPINVSNSQFLTDGGLSPGSNCSLSCALGRLPRTAKKTMTHRPKDINDARSRILYKSKTDNHKN